MNILSGDLGAKRSSKGGGWIRIRRYKSWIRISVINFSRSSTLLWTVYYRDQPCVGYRIFPDFFPEFRIRDILVHIRILIPGSWSPDPYIWLRYGSVSGSGSCAFSSAQLVERWPAERQAQVQISARHPREGFPHWVQLQWGNGARSRQMEMGDCIVLNHYLNWIYRP